MAIIFLYGMQLKMIAAVTKSMGIGYNGMLPWKVPADLSHFSRTTIGEGRNAIIMGRKTWESLPVKPLPKRINIVLTTDSSYSVGTTASIASSLDDAISLSIAGGVNDAWVIGGEKVYEEFIKEPLLQECVLTHLDFDKKCDSFFPKLDVSWSKVEEYPVAHNHSHRVVHYRRDSLESEETLVA